jgi:Zn-dependent peptidase ImmA (M78 family)
MIPVAWRDPQDFEVEAEKLLNQYGKSVRPITAPPVPVEHILEGFLDLQLEVDDLNPGNVKRDNLGCLYIEQKRVVVDSRLEDQEGRYNFTLAHEAGHWILHRDNYLREKDQLLLFEQETKPSIVCRVSQRKQPVEWQADRFASALLMPERMVKSLLQEKEGPQVPWIYDSRTKDLWGLDKDAYFRSVASRFNTRFGVSVQAMQIRLEQLDLLREEANMRLL